MSLLIVQSVFNYMSVSQYIASYNQFSKLHVVISV